MSGIEQYFKEEHWTRYSKLFIEPVDSEQFELLSKQTGDKELAKVIWGTMNNESLNWINKNVPALEGLKPVDCFSTKELKNRLKECLLRMP